MNEPNCADWIIAISSVVSTAAIIAAGFLAWKQLSGLHRQIGLSGVSQIFEQFGSEDLRKDRRAIYERMPSNVHDVDDELQVSIGRVLVSLDRIGFLVEERAVKVDRNLALFIGPPAIRIWDKLERYVDYERERRGETRYMCFFERFAKKCQKMLPDYKPKYY